MITTDSRGASQLEYIVVGAIVVVGGVGAWLALRGDVQEATATEGDCIETIAEGGVPRCAGQPGSGPNRQANGVSAALTAATGGPEPEVRPLPTGVTAGALETSPVFFDDDGVARFAVRDGSGEVSVYGAALGEDGNYYPDWGAPDGLDRDTPLASSGPTPGLHQAAFSPDPGTDSEPAATVPEGTQVAFVGDAWEWVLDNAWRNNEDVTSYDDPVQREIARTVDTGSGDGDGVIYDLDMVGRNQSEHQLYEQLWGYTGLEEVDRDHPDPPNGELTATLPAGATGMRVDLIRDVTVRAYARDLARKRGLDGVAPFDPEFWSEVRARIEADGREWPADYDYLLDPGALEETRALVAAMSEADLVMLRSGGMLAEALRLPPPTRPAFSGQGGANASGIVFAPVTRQPTEPRPEPTPRLRVDSAAFLNNRTILRDGEERTGLTISYGRNIEGDLLERLAGQEARMPLIVALADADPRTTSGVPIVMGGDGMIPGKVTRVAPLGEDFFTDLESMRAEMRLPPPTPGTADLTEAERRELAFIRAATGELEQATVMAEDVPGAVGNDMRGSRPNQQDCIDKTHTYHFFLSELERRNMLQHFRPDGELETWQPRPQGTPVQHVSLRLVSVRDPNLSFAVDGWFAEGPAAIMTEEGWFSRLRGASLYGIDELPSVVPAE